MKQQPTDFAGATIVTSSQWPHALQLCHSFSLYHPGKTFHLLALDLPPSGLSFPEHLQVTWAMDLGVPDFLVAAMQYQPLELVARVKSRFLLQLLDQHEKILYLAPEIQVCGALYSILTCLDTTPVILTPRYITPFAGEYPFEEIEALKSGHYHSGFLALHHGPISTAFLRWLDKRCHELAFDEPTQGLCLDQKWLNLAPCLFPGIHIERSPGLLVGPWNLHERSLSFQNNIWWVNSTVPLLLFFHQDSGPSLGPTPCSPLMGPLPFSPVSPFASFSDGLPISSVARRVFSISPFHTNGEDPFASTSQFALFCQQNYLVGSSHIQLHPEPLPPHSILSRLIRWSFCTVLRLFGAPWYERLLKYLRYLCSIRNQHELFFDHKTPERAGLAPQVYQRLK